MTHQQQMKETLSRAGLPYKKIDVYGSQIVVTAWSLDAAMKWGSLLALFATVKKIGLRSVDYAKENKGSNLNPTIIEVYRTYARLT